MKKYLSVLVIPALVVLFFSGCIKHTDPYTQTCNYDPCAYKVSDSEVVRVQHYLDSAGITATKHCSGLFYTIQNPGTGNAPVACSNVSVTYKGMFTNGQVFDSSNTAVDLSLARVIQGWANGVPLIKEGGSITLYIPPSLGYGPDPYRTIPGNSILIFNVGLVKVY